MKVCKLIKMSDSENSAVSPMKKMRILYEKQNIQHDQHENVSFKKSSDFILNKQTAEEQTKSDPQEDEEPLLKESPDQYVIFPIKHDDMWHLYKELVGNFWSTTETMQSIEALNLNENELEFLKKVFSFLASPNSSGFVIDNFAEEFSKQIQVTEAKFFYGHQLFMQNIHYEYYNRLVEMLITDAPERAKVLRNIESSSEVIKKREWIRSWTKVEFNQQLLASACMNGLFFMILDIMKSWLSNRIKGSTNNELLETIEKILIDKKLQAEFDCLMISHLKRKPTEKLIIELINQAARIEFEFLINLGFDLIGIETEELLKFIDEHVKWLKSRLIASFNERKSKKELIESSTDKLSSLNSNTGNKFSVDEDF
jgi:ribonucleotide reductase beta subunit family protein with ferritin-like domain